MRLFITLIAANLMATGLALTPGLYNSSDIIDFAQPADNPAAGEGEVISVGSLAARADEDDDHCYMQAFNGRDCKGEAGVTIKFSRTKGNHKCFDTRDRHSLRWSSGCGGGTIFYYEVTGCSIWKPGYVLVSDIGGKGCRNVDLDGHNWQSTFWQWGYRE